VQEETTAESIAYFKRKMDQLGHISSITISLKEGMVIRGKDTTLHLSGCKSGYKGCGAHGSIEILEMLGILLKYNYNNELAQKIFTEKNVCIKNLL
jgi:hypothetical protein